MTLIDTHCHLNFNRLSKRLPDLIDEAKMNSVERMVVPGTDVDSSKKAVELAETYEGVSAAVGIHPHHVWHYLKHPEELSEDLTKIALLLEKQVVVAVGEIGLDLHQYEQTKHEAYEITDEFVALQKELFKEQITLAIKFYKSVVVHNREASEQLLEILKNIWKEKMNNKMVFHCCEPKAELLEFAKSHEIFIGVDGDVTYFPEKQEFIKQVPLELLVLETDSPFLLPEPLRSEKRYPNVPGNLKVVAEFVAKLKNMQVEELAKVTTENAKRLFGI